MDASYLYANRSFMGPSTTFLQDCGALFSVCVTEIDF